MLYGKFIRHANESSTNICLEEIKRLSTRQRCVIQEKFKHLNSNPKKNGQKIFVMLLKDFPEYKLIWPQFRNISDSLIITADAVKQHRVVHLAGLKTIIGSMENEEKLAKAIRKIAVAHLKWHICKNHIMNMVQEVIVILQSYPQCGRKFMEEAWFTFFDVIGNLINKFKEGKISKY